MNPTKPRLHQQQHEEQDNDSGDEEEAEERCIFVYIATILSISKQSSIENVNPSFVLLVVNICEESREKGNDNSMGW